MFSVSLVHFVRIVPEFTCKSQFLFVCWQKHVYLKHSIPLIDTFVTCCILSLSYQNRIEIMLSYMVKCSNRFYYKWIRNCIHSVTSLVRSLPFVSLLSFLKRSKSRLLRSPCCVCVCVPPFQFVNQLTSFQETSYHIMLLDDTPDGYTSKFCTVSNTMTDVQTCEVRLLAMFLTFRSWNDKW